MADNDSNVGEARRRTPVHLWIVGVLAVLWNLMGAFDYLATQLQLDFYMSQFTEEQLAYFYAFPAWAVAGWAFAVWGGVVGSIGLLLRRKWSVWAFAVSLAGLFVSSVYNFGMSNGAEVMGTGGVIFSVIIWAVAIFLLVYARSQAKLDVLL
jgi:hypothetical protein